MIGILHGFLNTKYVSFYNLEQSFASKYLLIESKLYNFIVLIFNKLRINLRFMNVTFCII